ncbi:MAG: exodeoxyribonuclease VII large subunit [Bacteroidota bacterium]
MNQHLRLSELVNEIAEVISDRFEGEMFWIKAEITDVKKQPDKRWCFLKFIEKEGAFITSEMKAVFWANAYGSIERFEKLSGRIFSNGLEITCQVRVRFNNRYGMSLDVLDIDHAYTMGELELERQKTLERLVSENPETISLVNGQYVTRNKRLELPLVVQRIALVTAPGSDGQRDFKEVITKNKYGYAFSVTEFLTQVQGDAAGALLAGQLKLIGEAQEQFDLVAMVRGGGSQTDFKPFDDYELSRLIAGFPLPVITGIGHDRNTSIADMMARQLKTPTEAASYIVEHNFNFESEIIQLKDRFFRSAENLLNGARESLQNMKRIIKSYSPESILNKGYAIITVNGTIITNPADLNPDDEIQTILRNEIIESVITKKRSNETEL